MMRFQAVTTTIHGNLPTASLFSKASNSLSVCLLARFLKGFMWSVSVSICAFPPRLHVITQCVYRHLSSKASCGLSVFTRALSSRLHVTTQCVYSRRGFSKASCGLSVCLLARCPQGFMWSLSVSTRALLPQRLHVIFTEC